MPHNQPFVTDAAGSRSFACSPVAVVAFIVDGRERLLLLSSPRKRGAPGKWEVINGGLEAEETLLDGVLREVHEEAGQDIRVRPLGVIHAQTFRYDESIPYMISVCFLLAYDGGEVVPGDDMVGSEVRWASLDELENGTVDLLLPRDSWLPRRAIDAYRWLRGRPAVELQSPLPGAP
jgi:8-oxo-dGTP pyrophosphatase MutT (NUDIX family)